MFKNGNLGNPIAFNAIARGFYIDYGVHLTKLARKYRYKKAKMLSENYKSISLPNTDMIKKTVMEIIRQLTAAIRLSSIENSFLARNNKTFMGVYFTPKLGLPCLFLKKYRLSQKTEDKWYETLL